MRVTNHEAWALVHGVGIGGLFLLGFSAGLVALWSLRSELLTTAGVAQRVRHLRIGTTLMALMAWATVLTGTFVILPWYRADTPNSPKSLLLSNPDTSQWHTFADVWKTHVAWSSPLLATAAAALTVYYGRALARDRSARTVVFTLFVAAFAVSALAGLIGSLVTKAAPVH
jgi:hypothetical protein